MWFSFTMLNVEKCKVRDMTASERSRMNDDDDDGIFAFDCCMHFTIHTYQFQF